MKKVVFIVSILVLAGFIIGGVGNLFELSIPAYVLQAAFLLFAFVWMPLFLFYAYDRRQQKKESE